MPATTKQPARPTTPAQQARYQRIVDVATMIVLQSGEEALQMADLPELAEVSLTALYRYFPSKQHLLVAVVEHHFTAVLARTPQRASAGSSVRERTAEQMLRVYQLDQRVPRMAALLHRLGAIADSAFAAERARLADLQMQILLKAIGPISDHQKRLLPTVVNGADAAIRLGLAGFMPPAEVRFEILIACRLLDLPPETIEADRLAAESESPRTTKPSE